MYVASPNSLILKDKKPFMRHTRDMRHVFHSRHAAAHGPYADTPYTPYIYYNHLT
jgi:hypothetical protein